MKEELLRIENKIDKITERISSIDGTLIAQHVSLADHIRRTELLEAQLKPVERHVVMVHGAFKLIGILALLGGILGAIVEFLTYVKDAH